MAMANRSLRRRSISASLTIALEDQVARPIPAKRGALAGVPVPMDDGAAIAAAPEIICPLPGVARSGQKWRGLFAGDPPRPICGNWGGVGNAVVRVRVR
eukprot:scaffold2166_cov39-Phaeocystis_antarctica.AAC.1